MVTLWIAESSLGFSFHRQLSIYRKKKPLHNHAETNPLLRLSENAQIAQSFWCCERFQRQSGIIPPPKPERLRAIKILVKLLRISDNLNLLVSCTPFQPYRIAHIRDIPAPFKESSFAIYRSSSIHNFHSDHPASIRHPRFFAVSIFCRSDAFSRHTVIYRQKCPFEAFQLLDG